MTNQSNNQDQGSPLFSGRLVPIGREGNVVYARTLRHGEKDSGEAVHLGPGDRLVIPAGELVVNSRDIDEYHNPVGLGGYRPVANTIWAWHQFAKEQPEFYLFLFALARRTDATHALWVSAIEARNKAGTELGISQRQAAFKALASAEMAIIALGRCYRMVDTLVERYCQELQAPESVARTKKVVQEMRDAFEHIDERARGEVRKKRLVKDALTIFNQPDFVQASILRYKGYELNFESEVIAALIDCRDLIMDAIEHRQTVNKKQKRPE